MKWLFALFSILVVLLGGLAIAPSFFDWNQYKEPALKQVAELTGHEIFIGGDISLALLPSPRVYLGDVRVKDPTDSQGTKALAAFEELDVRVGLLPLFQGKAVVNSVHLDKPQIMLSKNAEGQFNFMTPKLEALMAAKDAVSRDAGGQKDAPVAVSFENVSITGGAFIYREAGAKAPIELTNVNVDVKASSLEGPFKAKGALVYNGQPVTFEAKTGKIDQKLQSTSLNLEAAMAGIAVSYAGVVSGGDAPEIQGETSIAVKSLSDLTKQDAPAGLGGELAMNGLLTATPEKASLKNASIQIGGKDLTGSIEASMKPISVKGAFTGQDIVDLDAFKGGSKNTGAPFDPAALGKSLPQTLEIPALGEIALSLDVPGVIVNGQVLKDVAVKLRNTDKSFAASADIGQIPGQGRVQASGALSFAEKSVSEKSGTEIYSDPSAAFEIKGQTQNLPQTVQAFSGLSGLPLVKDSKKGLFEIAGSLNSSGLSVSRGVINMDEAAFAVSGSWKGQNDSQVGSGRSLLKAKVVADSLNFDSLMGPSDESKTGDPLQPLKTLALPFDVDVDVTVNDAVLQGHEIKGLKIAAGIAPNALKINTIGADNFVGSKVSVKGGISNLKALSGLDIEASVNTPDPYKLASAFKVDTASWPKGLGATKANVKAQGSLEALDVNASVSAFGGEAGVNGKVSNPLTQLEIGGLAVSLKHSNMAKAIQTFAPGAPNYASLAKPMSFKADLALNGKVTSLKNINADLAGASTTGDLTFDGSGAKPGITGSLRIGDLVLKSGNTGSGGSSGGQSGGASKSGGKWSTAAMDTGWLHAMNASLDIAANSITYETWDLSKPAIKIALQGGTLNITDLKAGLYDGQIVSVGSVSSSGPKAPMNVKMASQISNINLGSLAKALAGSSRIQASGDVSLDFDVSGSGGSQSALVSSLTGDANLNGSNVVMKGFDLAGLAAALKESNKPLPRIQKIVDASTSGGETAFDTIKGVYAIQSGVVNITSMAMDGPEAAIASSGNVSLPRWFIDTNHHITLKNAPEVEPFDVAIKGSLDNPGNTFGSGLFPPGSNSSAPLSISSHR